MIRRRRSHLAAALAALAAALAPAPAASQATVASQAAATSRAPRASHAPAAARTPVDAAVAGLLAERWRVAAGDVALDWGAEGTPRGTPARLLGSGAGGVFVVELVAADGGTERRRVRAGVRASVAVAGRDLERGAVLEAADIARRDTVLWGGTGREADVAPGWVARRRIGAGSPLAPPAVSAPAAVEAGEAVTLVWRGGALEVTARATAAGTARVGDRVAVRTESGRRVWGVAESPGRVRIGGERE